MNEKDLLTAISGIDDRFITETQTAGIDTYFETRAQASTNETQLDLYYRTYVKALMEKDTDKTFYPDANLTLRVTYGNVKGFEPSDGVKYSHYTTI